MNLSSQEVEDRLRARLAEAQACWRRHRQSRSLPLALELGPRHPDGRLALTHSVTELKEYNAALRDYSQAVREWAEFVLRGRVPEWMLIEH